MFSVAAEGILALARTWLSAAFFSPIKRYPAKHLSDLRLQTSALDGLIPSKEGWVA
jgi:hypothetical protein